MSQFYKFGLKGQQMRQICLRLGLEPDQVLVLKRCFDGFADEEGAIPADNVGGILSMMGMKVKDTTPQDIFDKYIRSGPIFIGTTAACDAIRSGQFSV